MTPTTVHASKRRRGIILILATWIMVVLVAVTIVLAQRVRVETSASANRVAQLQADEIELGAEQWVFCQVDQMAGDALTVTETPAEAVQLDTGYFWLLRPVPDDPQSFDFGIVDECSKLNLNTATPDMIINLPNMTQEACDSIVDWIDTDDTVTNGDGAEDTEYMSLPIPYHCKNGPLESVDELNLVANVTPSILYGYDINRNGVIDDAENAASGGGAMFSTTDGEDPRGIYPFVTVWTLPPVDPTTGQPAASAGGSLTGNEAQVGGGGGAGGGGAGGTGGAGGGGGAGGTGGAATVAKINVNTAPLQVLRCLPGMTDDDAQSIVQGRTGGVDTTTTDWVSTVIDSATAQGIANYISATSYYYSADIVAVTKDGRAFKRVQIVVDASQTPPKVIYRRDLTELGWPLDPGILEDLKAGKEPRLTGINNGGL
ncbi:MAG TPA: type II secretion system protein GspK [Phycisphaerae bacterium]|nr:type II secretion system protein GspK [Phycisphaerae bacterium]